MIVRFTLVSIKNRGRKGVSEGEKMMRRKKKGTVC